MKQEELLFTHQLLNRVYNELDNQSPDGLTIHAYEQMNLSPTDITAHKAEHEQAVKVLSQQLAEHTETERKVAPNIN
jgi:Uncharacterised protein family UPF0058.